MADISSEIKDFQDAAYGEEVRGSMMSLAKKLNTEVEGNTSGVNLAVEATGTATINANTAATNANAAATNANAAAADAAATRQDILNRLVAGEFKGEKGDRGDKGDQGESGVMASASGMFSLFLDSATGNLYAEYPDGESPPAFEYDAATGNLYYVTG